MRFTIKELLQAGSHKWKESEVDVVILRNLEDLVLKINSLGYAPPMRATSCLRSIKDQQRINPSAMGSSHLYGCAVDIADPDGKFAKWIRGSFEILCNYGLWCENPEHTKGWVHLQTYAPKSFSRYFNP